MGGPKASPKQLATGFDEQWHSVGCAGAEKGRRDDVCLSFKSQEGWAPLAQFLCATMALAFCCKTVNSICLYLVTRNRRTSMVKGSEILWARLVY